MFEIVSPRKDESCYRFGVSLPGGTQRGYLTYELHPDKPHNRNLLLLNGSQDLLTPDQRREYQNLVDMLSVSRRGERTARAKSIVNRLVEDDLRLAGVRVAIHKFGPVPVYVLPEAYPVIMDEQPLAIQLALYPVLGRSGQARLPFAPEFMAGKLEFVRALQIDFDRLVQRYLEDVGECFFDIEHHLSLTKVFERAKEVETILGESIESKLVIAIPSEESWRFYRQGKTLDPVAEEVCHLFDARTDAIFTARFARAFALYFLNELYGLIGVGSRSAEYIDSFKSIIRTFDARFRSGWYKEATRERLGHLKGLYEALRAYRDREFEDLERISGETLWARKFIDFAKFVAAVSRFSTEFELAPEVGRIFVSHHHSVPSTEILRAQIQAWLRVEGRGMVSALFFKSPPGPPIRSSVKRLIWMSDSIEVIVPREPVPIGGSVKKSYSWMALEAEHGLLLDKRLLYLTEEGFDLGLVLQDFKLLDADFLSPTATIPREERLRRLSESLRDRIFAPFKLHDVDSTADLLDLRVREALTREIEEVVYSRHVEIIEGFYKQFPEKNRETLARIQELVPHPMKKTRSWIAKELHRVYPESYRSEEYAAKAVLSAWNLARARVLMLGGKREQLVQLSDRKFYSGRLREILRHLRSGAADSEILKLEKRILKSILPEAEF